MIVVCPACQARYRFDEAKLADRQKVKTRCAKCGGTIEIDNPLVGSATMPPGEPACTPPPARRRRRPPGAEPTGFSPDESLQTRETPETRGGRGTLAGGDALRMGILQLPKDKRFSLAVIQGPATGQIFPITKTRTLIGRTGRTSTSTTPRRHASTRRSRSWARSRCCATSARRTAPGSTSIGSSSSRSRTSRSSGSAATSSCSS